MSGAPVPRPYRPSDPTAAESPEALRARIPGWGVDLDPRDRPAVPRETPVADPGSDPLEPPEPQPELRPRERSVEHGMLPPVFGTAQPLRGVSGTMRRYSYARFSEGRAAHWLLLIAGDRIDVVESVARSLVSRRPDFPLLESGLRTEIAHHGLRERRSGTRADAVHHALDPVVVAGPWLLGAWVTARVVRTLKGRRG